MARHPNANLDAMTVPKDDPAQPVPPAAPAHAAPAAGTKMKVMLTPSACA